MLQTKRLITLRPWQNSQTSIVKNLKILVMRNSVLPHHKHCSSNIFARQTLSLRQTKNVLILLKTIALQILLVKKVFDVAKQSNILLDEQSANL